MHQWCVIAISCGGGIDGAGRCLVEEELDDPGPVPGCLAGGKQECGIAVPRARVRFGALPEQLLDHVCESSYCSGG